MPAYETISVASQKALENTEGIRQAYSIAPRAPTPLSATILHRSLPNLYSIFMALKNFISVFS